MIIKTQILIAKIIFTDIIFVRKENITIILGRFLCYIPVIVQKNIQKTHTMAFRFRRRVFTNKLLSYFIQPLFSFHFLFEFSQNISHSSSPRCCVCLVFANAAHMISIHFWYPLEIIKKLFWCVMLVQKLFYVLWNWLPWPVQVLNFWKWNEYTFRAD